MIIIIFKKFRYQIWDIHFKPRFISLYDR